MRPDSPTGLYWSIRGTVLCTQHLKEIDEDRWKCDGWEPLPSSSQAPEGYRYQCQRCSNDGTALAPLTDTPKSFNRQTSARDLFDF